MLAPLLLAALLAEPAADKPEVIARSTHWELFASGAPADKAVGVVIGDAVELAVGMGKPLDREKEALALAARAFKVKQVDFRKHRILVLAAGTKRTGGYSVEVTGVENKGDRLLVRWKLNVPPPGAVVTAALTNPGLAVLITRTPRKVGFDPPLPAK